MSVGASSTKHTRLEEIDVLKGLGIIIMVAGHVGFGNCFDFAIHSFNMPLFFIVSGYLYRCKVNDSSFVKRRVKSLLIPYILFGLVFCILWIPIQLYRGDNPLESIFHLLFFNSEGVPIAGALWFLTAFFFANIAFDSLFRLARGGLYITVFSMVSGCLGFLCPAQLPWCINQALIGVLFMFIGYEARCRSVYNLIKGAPLSMPVFALTVGGFAAYVNGFVNMRTNTYGNPVLFVAAAACLTFACFFLSQRLAFFDSGLTRELKYIGQNSMAYLCLNQAVLLIPMKLLPASDLYSLKLIILIFAMAALHWLALFLDNKCPLLLGK